MSAKDEVVERKQEVLAGTPVFRGTRVPIKVLFDYLKAGDDIEDFLKDFPTVERKKVVQLLELSSAVWRANLVRILLDESLRRRLKGDLVNHEVVTVPEMGWAGKANGDLLTLAGDRFHVFVTADQNLEY